MALIAGMMVSCDPITESDPGISANLTEADLQARVALTQTTAGQNKFTFSTNPTLCVPMLSEPASTGSSDLPATNWCATITFLF